MRTKLIFRICASDIDYLLVKFSINACKCIYFVPYADIIAAKGGECEWHHCNRKEFAEWSTIAVRLVDQVTDPNTECEPGRGAKNPQHIRDCADKCAVV